VHAAFVTQADYDLARDASLKTAEVCEDFEVLDAEQKARAKENLQLSSAGNILRTLLEEAADAEEIAELFIAKAQEPAFAVQIAGPLVASFVLMILYFTCCCWCGCCRYCRCCKRDWQCGRCGKLIFFVLLVGIGLALTVAAFLALTGLDAAVDGVERTACASAQLMNTTLQGGQPDLAFLGLLPILEILQSLSDSLSPDSDFICDLKGVIDNTQDISQAVYLASQTKSLLYDMMTLPANQIPTDSGGDSLLHECKLCSELSSVLGPAIAALDGSVATALKRAREEVNTQLSGSKLQELQANFETMSAPVDQFKVSLKSFLGPLIEEDLLDTVKAQMDTAGRGGAASFAILALLLTACGLLTVFCWCCTTPGNPKARVHRCACCTWCCGCWYLFLAFLVGGLLNLVVVPLSSFCLILEDLDGEILQDISAAANLNLTGAVGNMAISLVENCLNPPPNADVNPVLLDIITTTNSDGTTVSMNEAIVGTVTSQITKQFDAISLDTGGLALADTEELQMLIGTLRNLSMDEMMLPAESLASNSDYTAMLAEERLRNYLITSTSCTDGTFYGIDSFVANLSNYGTLETHSSCAKKVTCSGTQQNACDAANRFIDLKQKLLSVETFKCKYFKDALGQKCDLLSMTYDANTGTYANDCFLADGTLEKLEEFCTLQEFTSVVTSFATQIDLAMGRVDRVTPAALQKINVQLKSLVNQYLLVPIGRIVDGVTCDFMAKQYGNFVDGMCFRGVWGFTAIVASYVAAAVLTVFLVIVMYLIWRFALDSYEAEMGMSGMGLRAPDRE
ncbi:unnamed protein product, partial [Cladocopium goreaui]